MAIFLLIMVVVDFISIKQAIVIWLFHWLCELNNGFEFSIHTKDKEENDEN